MPTKKTKAKNQPLMPITMSAEKRAQRDRRREGRRAAIEARRERFTNILLRTKLWRAHRDLAIADIDLSDLEHLPIVEPLSIPAAKRPEPEPEPELEPESELDDRPAGRPLVRAYANQTPASRGHRCPKCGEPSHLPISCKELAAWLRTATVALRADAPAAP